MNNKTLTFLVILAVIAGGLFYLKSRPAPDVSLNSNTQSVSEVTTEAQKFAQAVESGKPYYCEMTSEDTVMTYHLKDGKMHMTSVTPDTNSFMINDGEYIYTWSDQSSQGYKIKVPTEEEVADMSKDGREASEQPSFSGEQDYQNYQEQGYTINCTSQAVDDALFTPPESITFADPAAMMDAAMPDGETLDMGKLQEMAKEYEGVMPEEN